MKSDSELNRHFQLKFGKNVRVERVRKKLGEIIGDKILKHYETESPDKVRNVISLLYEASQFDGGKTKWREKLIFQNDTVKYKKENYSLFSGSNRENSNRIKPILFFAELINDNKLVKHSDLFERKGLTMTPYLMKTQSLEIKIQDYINLHQRGRYDFSNAMTLMDDGLKDAISDARKIVTELENVESFSKDPIEITTLKIMELNLSRNDLATTIISAKENYKLDWFSADGFIKSSRNFRSLDTLEYSLSSSFDTPIPSGFLNVITVMLTGYIQKRLYSEITKHTKINDSSDIINIAYECNLINEFSFFIMAFVLMSMYENKTKLTVSVSGDSNKNRPIYFIIDQFANEKVANKGVRKFDFSPDVEDFIYDKYTLLASTPLDYCIETGNEKLFLKNMKSYSTYRAEKFEFILELYGLLNSSSVEFVDLLMDRFNEKVILLKNTH
jgi:hypothetical protein